MKITIWFGMLFMIMITGGFLYRYLQLGSAPDSGVQGHSHWARQYWPGRIEIFKKHPLKGGEVVFLGDSLTEKAYEFGQHLKMKPLSRFRNRGISGDNTYGVIARLGEILESKPQIVFLMIGINDLLWGKASPEEISLNIQAISRQFKEVSPTTVLVVQSLLPTNQNSLNLKVKEVNDRLIGLSEKGGFRYLDLHIAFLGEEGRIRSELTTDGLHLSKKGYELWGERISPWLLNFSKDGQLKP